MLPLHQAYEIKESIISYLRATFSFNDELVEDAFDQFIQDPSRGMFKGPYLSLKLPYVKATPEALKQNVLQIKPTWLPYDHQIKSWDRLHAKDKAKPTIITTGTGSGKTESFLYPILDHCHKHRDQKGIKAIILYPMNALATDQAKRLAEAIHDDKRLHGLRAGLFIGLGQGSKKNYPSTMSADKIIENREELLDSPPDILLTNFKMLDYGLMRSKYQGLWRHNIVAPSTMQYLVLDELHTYDGAQGTDVANLLRRLKLKLKIERGHLCPVGTSATIGSEASAKLDLALYASKLFGEDISEECIITDNRVSLTDFFNVSDADQLRYSTPSISDLEDSRDALTVSVDLYQKRVKKSWNLTEHSSPQDISNIIKENRLFYYVVDICRSGIISIEQMIKRLSRVSKDFRNVPEWDEEGQFSPRVALIESILSLLSMAKTDITGKTPLTNIQVQLWIKELSKVLRKVDQEISFIWNDSSYKQKDEVGLPPYYCRDCGASGWLAVKADNHNKFGRDPLDVYNKYFDHHKNLWLLNYSHIKAVSEYQDTEHIETCINKYTLEFSDGSDKENDIKIIAYRKLQNNKSEHYCPECNGKNTISIIGTRIATLSSIAVSQNLSTDLDNTDESNRKVLAFTNSVQDAAHQAGFVEARNYNFTFRSSLQQVINEINNDVSLKQLGEAFIKYWSKDEDNYYWRFFPKDYLNSANPNNYKQKNRYSDEFKKEFNHRMTWQVYEEFGNRALIGRTLEKSFASSVYIPTGIINEIFKDIMPWLKDNNLGYINQLAFIHFISILFYRIRVKGGVNHRYFKKAREGKLIMWELNWIKDSRHFLNPKYHENRSRFPKLINVDKNKKALTDSTYTTKINWFHQYFIKSFPISSNELINEFYMRLFEATTNMGLTDKVHAHDTVTYAIKPSALMVSKNIKRYKCDRCNSKIVVAQKSENLTGANCVNYRCTKGTYQEIALNTNSSNYYYNVYNRNLSPRIYSSEHTGLLERKKREYIENDFKERTKFNSLNVLVATSTLEMGIDIGTLNTAINNSIPPLPANYLQRIGRAGRATGSALILNFAKSQGHDLYYYDDPSKMMEGIVGTPGCYLDAIEILTRHYLAYCIDQWVSLDSEKNSIPTLIQNLKIKELDINSESFFVSKIFDYIDENRIDLESSFNKMYTFDLNQEKLDQVYAPYRKGYVRDKMKAVFERLKREERQINQQRVDIGARIRSEKISSTEPEYVVLTEEIKNLSKLWDSKTRKMTLEHLTNVGLLPNYAFPETGISLDALLIPAYTEGIISQDRKEEITITRGAGQAIKELAPDNSFFTQGHKLPISGINTVDWSDPLVKSTKRFCSNCDYISDQSNTTEKCPKCNHDSYGSITNIHNFLKLTGVRSVVNKRNSKLKDDKDERDTEIYNISQHLDFSKAIGTHAYIIEKEKLGIEFVTELNLRDVNLGHSQSVSANKSMINSREVASHGFVTCKHCGYSTSKPGLFTNRPESNNKMHYGYCKHKMHAYTNVEDEVFEHIFLYREFKTEGLKIRIPRTQIDENVDIKIISSALQLGLRLYFKGSPSHIQIREYKEWNKTLESFEYYIVFIDNIPGGSSYLQNVFDIEVFNKIMLLAFENLRDCGCQHEDLDGCYKCIYTYENQFIQEQLSRQKAVDILAKYIAKCNDWIQVDSLGSVANNGSQEESELEVRFTHWLEYLNNKNYNGATINVRTEKEYDVPFHLITLETVQHITTYSSRQQITIGPKQGVEYSTRPDVLLTCESVYNKSTSEWDNVDSLPKIAVYLDGYRYHAAGGTNKLSDDLIKREALAKSKKYLCWNLTWDDFDLYYDIGDNGTCDEMYEQLNSSKYSKTKSKLRHNNKSYLTNIEKCKNSLERFLSLLNNYHQYDAYLSTVALNIGYCHEKLFNPSYNAVNIGELLDFSRPLDTSQQYINTKEKLTSGVVTYEGIKELEFAKIRVLVNLVEKIVFYNLELIDQFNDLNKSQWKYFLQLLNYIAIFEKGVDIKETSIDLSFLEHFEEDYKHIIRALIEHNIITVNEKTEGELNELLDDTDTVIACAELILTKYKEVYEPYTQSDKVIFEKHGYTIKMPHQFNLNAYLKK